MIQKKLTQWKIINTLTLMIFLISCSTSKVESNSLVTTKFFLDDFIKNYNDYKPDLPLKAIIVYVEGSDKQMKVAVADAPLAVVLEEFKSVNGEYIIGTYRGIPCQLHYKNTNEFKNLLDDIQLNKTIQNGDDYNINPALVEYEPKIHIKYDVSKNKKNIQYSDGKIEIKKIW